MALPLLPLVASWGATAGQAFIAGGLFTVGSIIADATLPESDSASVIVLDNDTKQMIEDVIKTKINFNCYISPIGCFFIIFNKG